MSHSRFDNPTNGHKSFELPGAKPNYNPDRPGQVDHIFLDLSLDIPRQICRGTCHIRISPIRSGIEQITLDAVNLTIESVKIGKIKQDFDYDGEFLQIYL
jgi:aminopeptidase N